jgi:hypothetical protein
MESYYEHHQTVVLLCALVCFAELLNKKSLLFTEGIYFKTFQVKNPALRPFRFLTLSYDTKLIH